MDNALGIVGGRNIASEKVVRSSHSTQGHPKTIQEIKRILMLHANGLSAAPGRTP
jgi:hypothetical protein